LALATSLSAQDWKPQFAQGIRVELHTPIPLSIERLAFFCARPTTAALLRTALDSLATGKVAIRPGYAPARDTAKPEQPLVCDLQLLADTAAALPEDKVKEIVDTTLVGIEELLQAEFAAPIERDRKRLAELDEQAKQLDGRYLDLRRQAASLLRADLTNANAIVADLEKQRLTVELDLRTEKGVLDYLQEALAHTSKRLNELGEQRREFGVKKLQLRGLVTGMQKLLDGTKPEETERARKEFEALQQQLADVENAAAPTEADSKRTADQLEQLAADAQKATTTVQRLMVRISLLEPMLDEQRKKLAEAETAAAERDVVLASADYVKSQLTALLQRADELRARLADVEPVRIVRWN
jgi:chromosome segregation ATPase